MLVKPTNEQCRSDIMYKRDERWQLDKDHTKALQMYQQAQDLEKEDPFKSVVLYKRAFKLWPDLENHR